MPVIKKSPTERFCLSCSKKLTKLVGRFCDKDCELQARKQGIIDCKVCGKRILPGPNQTTSHFLSMRYCSVSCANRARNGALNSWLHPDIKPPPAKEVEYPKNCFRDDPRAVRDHGSPGRVTIPEHTRSLTGSTAALIVRGH